MKEENTSVKKNRMDQMVTDDHNTRFRGEQVSAIHVQLTQDTDKMIKSNFTSRIEIVVRRKGTSGAN